jgi:chromosome segregation ATPase
MSTPLSKSEIRRAKLKRAAQLRAQLAFEQNLARIDHRIDEIEPALDEIEQQAALGKPVTLELEGGDV